MYRIDEQLVALAIGALDSGHRARAIVERQRAPLPPRLATSTCRAHGSITRCRSRALAPCCQLSRRRWRDPCGCGCRRGAVSWSGRPPARPRTARDRRAPPYVVCGQPRSPASTSSTRSICRSASVSRCGPASTRWPRFVSGPGVEAIEVRSLAGVSRCPSPRAESSSHGIAPDIEARTRPLG